MTATIHHIHRDSDRTPPQQAPGDASLDVELQAWFAERMSAMHLHCEAASLWLDRPEPDILEARLAIESLRADLAELIGRLS